MTSSFQGISCGKLQDHATYTFGHELYAQKLGDTVVVSDNTGSSTCALHVCGESTGIRHENVFEVASLHVEFETGGKFTLFTSDRYLPAIRTSTGMTKRIRFYGVRASGYNSRTAFIDVEIFGEAKITVRNYITMDRGEPNAMICRMWLWTPGMPYITMRTDDFWDEGDLYTGLSVDMFNAKTTFFTKRFPSLESPGALSTVEFTELRGLASRLTRYFRKPDAESIAIGAIEKARPSRIVEMFSRLSFNPLTWTVWDHTNKGRLASYKAIANQLVKSVRWATPSRELTQNVESDNKPFVLFLFKSRLKLSLRGIESVMEMRASGSSKQIIVIDVPSTHPDFKALIPTLRAKHGDESFVAIYGYAIGSDSHSIEVDLDIDSRMMWYHDEYCSLLNDDEASDDTVLGLDDLATFDGAKPTEVRVEPFSVGPLAVTTNVDPVMTISVVSTSSSGGRVEKVRDDCSVISSSSTKSSESLSSSKRGHKTRLRAVREKFYKKTYHAIMHKTFSRDQEKKWGRKRLFDSSMYDPADLDDPTLVTIRQPIRIDKDGRRHKVGGTFTFVIGDSPFGVSIGAKHRVNGTLDVTVAPESVGVQSPFGMCLSQGYARGPESIAHPFPPDHAINIRHINLCVKSPTFPKVFDECVADILVDFIKEELKVCLFDSEEVVRAVTSLWLPKISIERK